jgi:hypothetical protein
LVILSLPELDLMSAGQQAKGHIPDNTPVNKNIAIIGMKIESLFIFWGTSMSYLSKNKIFHRAARNKNQKGPPSSILTISLVHKKELFQKPDVMWLVANSILG